MKACLASVINRCWDTRAHTQLSDMLQATPEYHQVVFSTVVQSSSHVWSHKQLRLQAIDHCSAAIDIR